MEPRPVSRAEAALLTAILEGEPGVGPDLRSHLDTVEAQSGCNCGCGSLDFVYPDDIINDLSRGPATVYPVEAEVLDDYGAVVGGVLLFVRDGRLDNLDVYSHGAPLPLPTVGSVRLVRRS